MADGTRQRKLHRKQPKDEDELSNDWKPLSTDRVVKKEEHKDSMNTSGEIPQRPRKTARRKCCGLFKYIFDCVWTIVLLLVLFVAIVNTFPSVKNHITTAGHSRIYHVNRLLRLLFVYVEPYLGIDSTQTCLVLNPFANNTMQCPCMNNLDPITIQLTQQHVPKNILIDSFRNPYILKDAISIEEDYGRSTLVRLVNETGTLPDACYQFGTDEVPVEYHSLNDDHYWDELLNLKDSWVFTWLECVPTLYMLLPNFLEIFPNSEEYLLYYTLSNQWAKSIPPFDENLQSRRILVVLEGTVRIYLHPSPQCSEFCWSPSNRLLILSQGDILLLNELYWFYSFQTWSETSFSVTTFLKFKED